MRTLRLTSVLIFVTAPFSAHSVPLVSTADCVEVDLSGAPID